MKFQFEVSNPEEKFLMEFEANIVKRATIVRKNEECACHYFLAENHSVPIEKNGKVWKDAFSLEIINEVFIIVPYKDFKMNGPLPVS